ncbi:MAG TPA: Hpt domain-containing protein, partial [Rhodocyclaceae bacterium]
MAIDMSQFFQVFYEETEEHLANMESLLLALDVGSPDPEQLNAVFRAAHSIKGSAGTFGFSDLAQVTHILENLLDRIRKGELALREEMIDAFLDAGDVLKVLLSAHKGEGESDPGQVEALCARLNQLTSNESAAAGAAAEPAPSPAGGLDIRFVLDGDAESARRHVDKLMTQLQTLGAARVVEHPAAPG